MRLYSLGCVGPGWKDRFSHDVPQMFAVITIKFEKNGHVMMCLTEANGKANRADPNQTASICLICLLEPLDQ